MHRHMIATSSNGHQIYVDVLSSAAGRYISRQPYVIALLKELLGTRSLSGETVAFAHNMGRNIGKTDIVETTEKDIIYYAQPFKKTVFSRYAKNRYPAASNSLTVMLRRDPSDGYELVDTWIGPFSPPFPGDPHETAESKLFWQTHALVPGAENIQSKTITKTCPY